MYLVTIDSFGRFTHAHRKGMMLGLDPSTRQFLVLSENMRNIAGFFLPVLLLQLLGFLLYRIIADDPV